MDNLSDEKLKKILLSEAYISEDDIKRADKYLTKHKDQQMTFADYLVKEGILTPSLMGQAIAEFFEIAYANLAVRKPERDLVLSLPESLSKGLRCILMQENEKSVTLATDSPTKEKREKLEIFFKPKSVSFAYALPEDVDNIFIFYRKPLDTRFNSIIEQHDEIAPEIITEILEDAITFQSSDIHIEPQKEEVLIRFRIDGVLHEAGRIPKKYYENILNRIKVQARMRIDDHFSPQDGAMRFEMKEDKKPVDMRVSIVPTLYGEKIVFRILTQYVSDLTLGSLGLSTVNQDIFLRASKKPFGMILITGPTGSGKSTSLYALLRIVNSPEINITTVEDPIEYKLVGINQIQANPKAGLTFAEGLRSIVRQDPDVILVGEIRDRETTEMAINAALTGHLLFSTFHANNAATAIPRLLDMGVEPFLLASTLEVVAAQRLVRKICTNCRYSVPITRKELEEMIQHSAYYFPEKNNNLYKGKGCDACGGTGYKGRVALYEFIEVRDNIKALMLKNPSTKQIWDMARTNGAKTMFEDGVEKAKNGITSLEEVLRLTAPPETVEEIAESQKKIPEEK